MRNMPDSNQPASAPGRRARAFSLVELMVVIGIIAVLMSILIPVVSRAKRQARNVQCLSNLRSLEQAFIGYVNTNRHAPVFLNPGAGNVKTWAANFKEIYSNKNVQICPEAPASPVPTGSPTTFGNATMAYGDPQTPESVGSYGFNGFFYYPNDPDQVAGKNGQSVQDRGGVKFTGLPQNAIDACWFSDPVTADGGTIPAVVTNRPSGFGGADTIPIFGDCNSFDAWPQSSPATDPTPSAGGYVIGTGDTSSSRHGIGRFCMDRHPGMTVNIVFLDGHAGPVKLPDLWQLRWHKSFNPRTVTIP